MKILRTTLLTAAFILSLSVAAAAQTKGVVTGNKVNVREQGRMDGAILYRVNQGEPVEVLGKEGDFYLVNVKQDTEVYIARQYVNLTEIVGLVYSNPGLLYSVPDEPSGVAVGMLSPGERVVVESASQDWYKLNDGYIQKKYIAVPDYVPVPEARFQSSAPEARLQPAINAKADDIIDYAKTFLGVKYIYGAMNPKRGFDCSGYITYVLQRFNVSVSRNSAAMSGNGVAVNKGDLAKGDLVFFATSGGKRISHVGMYIGDGQFIHASSWRDGVIIDTLQSGYYARCYVKAVRVL